MRLVLSLIVLSFFLAACGNNIPEAGTAGQLIEWEDHCMEANDGQRLALEGYFNYGNSFSENRDGTAYIEFRNHNFDIIPVYISVGTGAGQVKEPPFSYQLQDIQVQSSAGEVLAYQDTARFHFTLKYNGLNAVGNPSCDYQGPYLIEAVGAADSTEATEEAGE